MQQTIVRRPVPAADLSDRFHPVVKRVLAARGIREDADLDTSLEGLHRAEALGGIDAAVQLLEAAVVEDKRIVIVGDFDADGATSCAVGIRALSAMGANHVSYLVPNRFEYGYGLTPPIVALAAERRPDLLITVDNGISSIDGVAAARAAGIDVLITDHHLPGKELPNANAIVNPNCPGDEFPSKALAGVGVIFYVMLALRRQLADSGWFKAQGLEFPNLARLLDLVALGTVADVVPLDQNNRRLVAQGIARIRAGHTQPGIAALLIVAGKDPKQVSAMDLGFALGPRLNAAGRLADMSVGIECLLNDDPKECERAAIALDGLNRERREIESEMRQQALSLVDEMLIDETSSLPAGLCLYDETWHQGVVGIIASRIKERFHRPVMAFAPTDDGDLKGSGRSIAGVHMRDALDAIAAQNPGLIEKFGGHAMAAGLSLRVELFEQFSDAFALEVARQLGPQGLRPEICTDGELAESDFSLELAEQLAVAAPWGQLFAEPLFDGDFIVEERRIVGETHLKMKLRPRAGAHAIDAIAFSAADEPWSLDAGAITAAYRLAVNEYRGKRTLQLIVEHATQIDDEI